MVAARQGAVLTTAAINSIIKLARRELNMKKTIRLFAALLFVCVAYAPFAANPVSAAELERVTVFVNGDYVQLDAEPVIENGYVLVPMRAIFEALDTPVYWDKETQSAQAVRGEAVIFTVNSDRMFKNGRKTYMETAARLINDRLFIPLSALDGWLGAELDWNGQTREAALTLGKPVFGIDSLVFPEGVDPYFVLFEWIHQAGFSLNFGIKYIAADMTEAKRLITRII